VIDVANIVRDVMPHVSVQVVPDDPDRRTYNVCFDRINTELGFHALFSIPDSVAEMRQRMTNGTVLPFGDLRTKTLDYYSWLLKARAVLDDVSLGGQLF
jgi:hypothetical protein